MPAAHTPDMMTVHHVTRPLIPILILLTGFAAVPGDAAARVQAASRAGDVRPVAVFDSSYSAILSRVVDQEGLVDYAALRGPLASGFRRVLKAVETLDPAALTSRSEKLAFWMNAYNVQMLQHIIESEGLTNVVADGRDEKFFRTPLLTAGLAVSLDDIENRILRGPTTDGPLATYAMDETDPRLHAGVNCAAISCPRLRMRAFTSDNVDEVLDAAMREFVSSPRHFRVEDGVLIASSIIDWYGADFDRTDPETGADVPAGDYLLTYMDPDRPNAEAMRRLLSGRSSDDLRTALDVRFDYDWTVNDRALHE